MPTVDELIAEYKLSEECGFTPSERLELCSWTNLGLLVAEVERLRQAAMLHENSIEAWLLQIDAARAQKQEQAGE